MKKIILIPLCIACHSCSIYNSQFDCPPGKGIGCSPVHEVLNLIVENEDEEDFFVSTRQEAKRLKRQKKQGKHSAPESPKKLYLLKESSGDKILIEAPQ